MTPDESLTQNILKKLRAHPELVISKVEITVDRGHVAINGEVPNADMKSTIEAQVANVPGVLDVSNYLQLEDAFESGSGDGLHHPL